MKIEKIKKDEEGFILVVAMLIMLLLTILGVASITTSTIEVQIADNVKRHIEHFNQAEAANMRVLQIMTNVADTNPENLKLISEPWLSNGKVAGSTLAEARNPAWWDKAGSKVVTLDTTDPNCKARFAALNMGQVPGSSTGVISGGKPYFFVCLGLYHEEEGPERGMVLVETGFIGNI